MAGFLGLAVRAYRLLHGLARTRRQSGIDDGGEYFHNGQGRVGYGQVVLERVVVGAAVGPVLADPFPAVPETEAPTAADPRRMAGRGAGNRIWAALSWRHGFSKRRKRMGKVGRSLNNDTDGNAQHWTVSPGDGPGVVVLTGEIDFSVTQAVRERLMEAVGQEPREIVLDMADLAYIDSSGLALLIELRKVLAEAGRTVAIRTISPQVRKLFNLTQLGELFGLPE